VKDSWTVALGLMLVLEGVMPFFFPAKWKDAFQRMIQLSDGQIRFIGLVALLCGLMLLALANYLF
jgi:uncharacterized protein YjeT (DUF2065 family)